MWCLQGYIAMACSSHLDESVQSLSIIKRLRRGPNWVLRFFESQILQECETKLYPDLTEWLDDNAPGWRWKVVMSRNSLGWWGKYDWYRPEVIDGEYVDIMFPDQGSMIAFILRWA